MSAIDWTLSIGEFFILLGVTGVLAISGLRLRAAQAAERRAAATGRDLRALIERVEALVQASAGPLTFATSPGETACLREDSEVLDEGLVSRLAVAVSILVEHADLTRAEEADQEPGAELLSAVRESCLAIIETVWIKDLNNAYDASRRRRETLFKRCCSVAELRECIHREDADLRADMDRLSGRLEEMLLATDGRYAKASIKLTKALRRMLK